jgi:hypothetical protein
MSLPPIEIIITGRDGRFQTVAGNVDQRLAALKERADAVAARMQVVGQRMAAVGSTMTVAAVAATALAVSLVRIVNNGAKVGDAIAVASKQTGLSTTRFQEMAFALEQVGDVSREDFVAQMTILNRKLGEAGAGSAAAVKAFERIGISQADIASGAITTDIALDALIARLGETTDPAAAAALATALLGKAGAKTGASLAGAAGEIDAMVKRAHELGVIMGPDAIVAAGKYGDQVDALRRQWEALQLHLASELLPFFVNDLIPFLQNEFLPALKGIIDAVSSVIGAFQGLPVPVQQAANAMATAMSPSSAMMLVIAAAQEAAGTLATAWEEWGGRFKAAVGGAIDWVTQKFTALMALIDRIKTTMAEVFASTPEVTQRARDALSSSGAGLGPGFSQNGINAPGSGEPAPGGAGGGGGGGLGLIGVEAANGLVNGFVGTMLLRQPEIDAAIQGVTTRAREILGVQSPSTVFAEIGGFIGEGMANGIAASTGVVAEAVNRMGLGAIDGANNTTAGVLGAMQTLFQGNQRIAAALAWINTIQGASEEIKKKGTLGFAAAAAVVAKGLGFVKAIQGTSASGSGVGRVGGGGRGGASEAPQAQVASPAEVYLTWNGPMTAQSAGELTKKLNAEYRQGYRLNFVPS